MNRSEAKELLPIIQAFAEGKEIEFRSKGFDEEWKKVNEIPGLSYSSFDYRVKSEPKYRPFKDADECWQEMQKHQPFGWVKSKRRKDCFINIVQLHNISGETVANFTFTTVNGSKTLLEGYTFADGAPFGVKEE
nr:MAG TPA: hypothetical protein [Caudoviricetes sp.]